MTRFLIYLFPAIFDMLLYCAVLTSSMRMAASGASATATAGVTATWAITYILAGLLIGRWVTPHNAARLIITGGVIAAAGSAGFIVVHALPLIYIFITAVSVGCAFFFTPFQIFMKAVEQEHESGSVVRSTALYTLSWSGGAAAGPFIAGMIWSLTGAWQYGYAVSGVAALSVSVGVFLIRFYAKKQPSHHRTDASEAPPKSMARDQHYEKLPDFAWLGWVGAGAGIFCFFLITGLFPVTAKYWSLSKAEQGIVLALMLGTQAITGFCLGFGRFWMYRRTLMATFGLFGATGLVLYALGQSMGMFCLAAVCFGMYSGSFFFYLVFHAIIHPHRSGRYVSINEAVVGVCGFVGPMTGGLLADSLGLVWPYLTAIGLVATGVLLKLMVHTRFRPRVYELRKIL